MKSKITIPVFAIFFAIAIALVGLAFSPKEKNQPQKKTDEKAFFANYYYRFTGSPGQENNTSLWVLISATDYSNSSCSEEKNGCVIKTISSATTAPTHPALVPVSGTLGDMTPVVDGTNIASAKFKNPK